MIDRLIVLSRPWSVDRDRKLGSPRVDLRSTDGSSPPCMLLPRHVAAVCRVRVPFNPLREEGGAHPTDIETARQLAGDYYTLHLPSCCSNPAGKLFGDVDTRPD
jgi:hypothetical protein